VTRRARKLSAVLPRIAAVAAAVAAGGATAGAQTTAGDCAVSPAIVSGVDACRKGQDLFSLLVPQVGVALSGGNPTLGDAGSLGGWGKRSIGLRLTAVDGRVPANDVPVRVSGSAVASDFGAQRAPIPVPSLDAAIGLTKGIPLGLTNAGGVDVLFGLTYLPRVSEDNLELAPTGSAYAFGYGLRVGALQESSLVPGVSVSYMRRKLPTMDFGYVSDNDELRVQDFSLTSDAIRVVASKRILFVGLAAGVGRDRIDGQSSLRATVNETVLGNPQQFTASLPALRTRTSRNTAFVNASLNLVLARLVAEYGWSTSGESLNTLNTFGTHQANEGYRYGSVGLSVRF
jgi:hypothetical protein